MATEKVYSHVPEAEKMIQGLCAAYKDVMWQVNPDVVAVLGIENKKRSKKNLVMAKIIPIKGVEKAIMQLNNVNTRYVIEVYWSDWNEWKQNLKQWIILHELLHISHDIGRTIKHDCEDFKIIIDKVGVNWLKCENLPDLINGKIDFDLELRPGLEDEDEKGEDEKDEIEDTKEEKPKSDKDIKDSKEDKFNPKEE